MLTPKTLLKPLLVSNTNFGANAASTEAEFLSASGVIKVANSFTEFINRLEC